MSLSKVLGLVLTYCHHHAGVIPSSGSSRRNLLNSGCRDYRFDGQARRDEFQARASGSKVNAVCCGEVEEVQRFGERSELGDGHWNRGRTVGES